MGAVDPLTGKAISDLSPMELLAHLRGLDATSIRGLAQRSDPVSTGRRTDQHAGDWFGPNSSVEPGSGGRGPSGELVPDSLEWHDVSSSNVRRIAYQVDFQRLYVEFHSGALYAYEGFEESRWEDFLASDSKGLFVFHVLRNEGTDSNTYAYRQIRAGYRKKSVQAWG